MVDFRLPDAEFYNQMFCRDCGSVMPTVNDAFDIVMIPAGALDQDPGIRPAAHIFVESKASWFDITDDLEQFAAMPPG